MTRSVVRDRADCTGGGVATGGGRGRPPADRWSVDRGGGQVAGHAVSWMGPKRTTPTAR